MNLRLEVFKTDFMSDYSQGRHIRFAVVDLDKSKKYPANYICLLPMDPRANSKSNSIFLKLFGSESPELAKRLLTKALKTERDAETKAEIEKRLELLIPMTPVQVKCRVCGKSFEPVRGRFRQKICQECKQKRYTKQ